MRDRLRVENGTSEVTSGPLAPSFRSGFPSHGLQVDFTAIRSASYAASDAVLPQMAACSQLYNHYVHASQLVESATPEMVGQASNTSRRLSAMFGILIPRTSRYMYLALSVPSLGALSMWKKLPAIQRSAQRQGRRIYRNA